MFPIQYIFKLIAAARVKLIFQTSFSNDAREVLVEHDNTSTLWMIIAE